MRREDLYIASNGTGYIGSYRARRRWKERRNKAAKIMAVFLASMLGVVTVSRGAGELARVRLQEDLQEQYLPAGLIRAEKLTIPQELLQPETEELEEEPAMPYGAVPGATWKEAGDLLVVLDPGHGGMDGGCFRDGVLEKHVNMEIARAVESKLKELGYQVRMTRHYDTDRTLEERVEYANKIGADLYVSIHQNDSDVAGVNGMEIWYNGQQAGAESERLASLLQKYVLESTGAKEREIVEENTLYVTRECTMASCLIETGFLSDRKERRNLVDSQYQEQIAQGIANGIELYFHPKTMYLTFDDGPSVENTEKVLDVLKDRGILATFFLIGENVERYPEIARRIAAEGHTIGIHCNQHVYGELYKDVDSYLRDFQEAHRIIKEITGVDAKLFRFPGGSVNTYNKTVHGEIARQLTAQGYIYYDWNASLEDAVKNPREDQLIENAVSSTLGRKSVVLLAHDVIDETASCLDRLLDQFPEYQMEPLTPESEPVQFS